VQRKPAASGAPLVNRVNGELFKTVFRMQIGRLAAEGSPTPPSECAAQEREAEIEQRNRAGFVPLALSGQDPEP
jgi:hypothetical protein